MFLSIILISNCLVEKLFEALYYDQIQ